MLIEPPFPLGEGAEPHWIRHTDRIYAEGRASIVNLDALVMYCDAVAMYQRAMRLVFMEGMTRDGERGGMTKHPAITILTGLRSDIWRYARLIPLYDADAEAGDGLDGFLADAEKWANATPEK